MPLTPNRNDMAFWWPVLKQTGVLVPKTVLIETDAPLIQLCDGENPKGYDDFLGLLRAACDAMGYPVFLRTGETSGKHSWRRTCFLERGEDLASHVYELVEFSAMADFFGLSTRTWAVREFIQLEHYFTAFEGMPVAREFRCFFEGGNPVPICWHPYWPERSIREPSEPNWVDRLQFISGMGSQTIHALNKIVAQVAPHFDGRWSLDLACDVHGRWYATDMAEMDRSFHWRGCPNDPHPEHHHDEPTDEEREDLANQLLTDVREDHPCP